VKCHAGNSLNFNLEKQQGQKKREEIRDQRAETQQLQLTSATALNQLKIKEDVKYLKISAEED